RWRTYWREVRAVFRGECVAPFRSEYARKVRFVGVRNSGASAIALAAYCGARRIVLIGYDCQHTGGRRHWHEDHPASASGNAGTVRHWPAMFRDVASRLKGVEVVNASRETALDTFPRASLECAMG